MLSRVGPLGDSGSVQRHLAMLIWHGGRAVIRRLSCLGEAGSGMAIGVAMVFPMLMLVIVSLNALAETSRIEQNLQATANRAARTASLCCYGTGEAVAVVESSLAAAESASAINRVVCNNDFVGDSRTVFVDAAGQEVAIDPDSAVPPAGTVFVVLRCVLPPQSLSGFGLPGLDVERQITGSASVDPYRHRSDRD